MKSVITRTLAGVCLFTAASSLWATQPDTVDVSLQSKLVLRGNSILHVVNNTREPQEMIFSPGPLGTLPFNTQRASLRPGTAIDVSLGQMAFPQGNSILHVVTQVGAAPNQMAGPSLHEIFVVDRTGLAPTTYEAAYLDRRQSIPGESRPAPIDIGGGYMDKRPMARLAWPSDVLPPDVTVSRSDYPSTFELSRLPLRSLPEAGGGSSSSTATGAHKGEDNGGEKLGAVSTFRAMAKLPVQERSAGVWGSIKGNIAVKIPNPAGGGFVFPGAWGWSVRAWQLLGSTWIQIGGTNAAGDGSWSIDYLIPPFPGLKVRIDYQPANRFMQVQDANANVYTWGDSWDMTGSVTNIGNRTINLTANGFAPGIDTIYQSASALWRKFNSYGMSPLRDEPIEITYPNTLATGKCTSTDSLNNTIPWSCSQSNDGKIWLIQKHAVAGVVQHEIAHSIHSYYWNGNMPSGGGIKHNLSKCYNGGLALTEGFADFMPYWVQFARNTVSPVEPTLNLNIESLGANFCAGSSNEAHVAATFWDVYDTVGDGSGIAIDDWNFTHAYAPVSTFLNNPGHNSMIEYMAVYDNILGPSWGTHVFNLFILNTTFLP